MKIVKVIQWDMGHRVMNHRSICKGLHGHRYKAEVCLEGGIVSKEGVSEEGMVVDFSDIKSISHNEILNKLDHAFMVWDKDIELITYMNSSNDHKVVIVPFTPTAENVSKYIFEVLDSKFKDVYKTGLKLCSIKLWETPTSYAIYTKNDNN